jgi:uroporphyrinogen decarboxylase
MTITSKERVRKALNHEETDRIPIDTGGFLSGICYLAYDNLRKMLGIELKEKEWVGRITGVVDLDEEVLKKFHVDTRYVYLKDSDSHNPQWLGNNSFMDEWGIRWTKPKSSYYFDMENHPLEKATLNDLKKWIWPDPKARGRAEGLKEKAKIFNNSGYAVFTVVPGPFELIQYLRGMERLFMDFYDNPGFLKKILDNITEILISLNDVFLEEVGTYLDCILYYSDLGDQ